MAKVIVDLTGRSFGHLKVLSMASRKVGEDGKLLPIEWHCKCEACGKEIDIPGTQLRNSSNRTSCGCIKKQAKAPAVKKDIAGIIKRASRPLPEPDHYGRMWGPCRWRVKTCDLSRAGWCCHDCRVPDCEDRCLNTPGKDKIKHCGTGRLKK